MSVSSWPEISQKETEEKRACAHSQRLMGGDKPRGRDHETSMSLLLLPPGKNVEQARHQIRQADREMDLEVPCVTGYKVLVLLSIYNFEGPCLIKYVCSSTLLRTTLEVVPE